jgi:hypothetical protein
MNAPAYYPRPGSLAAQVVYFFRTNAGEELTLEDIFTVASILRSYVVRRWFNAVLHRAVVRVTTGGAA